MGNLLFQQAKQAVHQAEMKVKGASTPQQLAEAYHEITIAKNNLSSAFAQSTIAEKRQLSEMQNNIDRLEQNLPEYD